MSLQIPSDRHFPFGLSLKTIQTWNLADRDRTPLVSGNARKMPVSITGFASQQASPNIQGTGPPDEKHLYVADTGGLPWLPDPKLRDAPATVSAYAVGKDHELSAKPVWRIETLCDGMCVDVQGNIYATGKEGVSIWKADGTQLGLIEVPEQPANVCFGGEDFKTLFITARTSLYSVKLDVAGSKPINAKW